MRWSHKTNTRITFPCREYIYTKPTHTKNPTNNTPNNNLNTQEQRGGGGFIYKYLLFYLTTTLYLSI